jgi:hypothetical protein
VRHDEASTEPARLKSDEQIAICRKQLVEV